MPTPYLPGSLAVLIEQCQGMLGEYDSTPGGQDPFAWVRLLQTEVDSLARGTYCLHGSFDMGVTAGQADYCAPPVFRITAVLFTDVNGCRKPLLMANRRLLNGYPCVFWGSQFFDVGSCENGATGTPEAYISAGENSVTLYPTPDTTLGVLDTDPAGGLTIEGYYAPGADWALDPNNPSDPLAAVCPLPARDLETVINGAALRRIKQFPTTENLARLPLILEDYKLGRGKMERESATLTADRR